MHLALLAKNKTKSESPTDTLQEKNKSDSATIKRVKNASVSSSDTYFGTEGVYSKHTGKELTAIILFGSWKFSLPVNVPPLILSLIKVSPKGPRVPRNC